MAGRAAPTARGHVGRLRDRRDDGQLHGLAAARTGPAPASAGTSRRTASSGRRRSRVIVGADATSRSTWRCALLGLGTAAPSAVAADEQGRMRPAALARRPRGVDGPAIVCAQAGNVNTGAFDPIGAIADASRTRADAWLHVDGAFGLWAAASPRLAPPRRGRRGRRLVGDRRPQVAQRAVRLRFRLRARRRGPPGGHGATAAYLPPAPGQERDPSSGRPSSPVAPGGSPSTRRSASSVPTGIAEIVERDCDMAARIARGLAAIPGVRLPERGRAQSADLRRGRAMRR